jgi:hypothetical protein
MRLPNKLIGRVALAHALAFLLGGCVERMHRPDVSQVRCELDGISTNLLQSKIRDYLRSIKSPTVAEVDITVRRHPTQCYAIGRSALPSRLFGSDLFFRFDETGEIVDTWPGQ